MIFRDLSFLVCFNGFCQKKSAFYTKCDRIFLTSTFFDGKTSKSFKNGCFKNRQKFSYPVMKGNQILSTRHASNKKSASKKAQKLQFLYPQKKRKTCFLHLPCRHYSFHKKLSRQSAGYALICLDLKKPTKSRDVSQKTFQLPISNKISDHQKSLIWLQFF